MSAQLLALSDGPTLILDKPIVLVGRQSECDIQLNSRKVSRRHCVIAQVNDYLVVRDLGSTNGVRINGQRQLEGKLQAGDELTIGNFRYRVHVTSENGEPRPVRLSESNGPSDASLEHAELPVPLDEGSVKGKVLAARPAPKVDDSDESFVLPEKLRSAELAKYHRKM